MNENIKELAVKAGYLADQDYDLDFYAYEWFDIKVFAKLIVRECMEQCFSEDDEQRIAKHFGFFIEEE